MKESYGEGLATHTGPESCAAVREALTGVRAGRVFSRERTLLRDADAVEEGGRPHPARRARQTRWSPARSTDPGHAPDTPRARTGRAWGRPLRMARRAASGSPRTHADDGRPRAVGQARSTNEVSEQRRSIGRGGDGGKGSGQREPEPAKRAPDTEPGGALSALERVRRAAERDKQVRFTALLHHVYNVEHLRAAYDALKRGAAPGIDGETWEHYGQALEANLADLAGRLKRGAYRAKPVKRTYIPEGRRAAAAAGHSHAGRQARPAHDGRGAEHDLRDRLPRLLLWVSAGAQPAQRAGCALCRAPDAEGELGARCRHSGVFRGHQPRAGWCSSSSTGLRTGASCG